MRRSSLALALTCLASVPAYAAPDGPSWDPEFGLETGITFGGGNLVVSGVTGQPSLTPSNENLYAGNTFFLQGYYRQTIGSTGLSFKAAAGGTAACQIPVCLDILLEAFGGSSVDNYNFGSATGDLLVEYAWEGGRVGVGRTFRALNVLGSSDDAYPFQDVSLKPAQGWILEYEKGPLGLKYTHLTYRSRTSSYSLNASNVGVYLHVNYRDESWYPGLPMTQLRAAFVDPRGTLNDWFTLGR